MFLWFFILCIRFSFAMRNSATPKTEYFPFSPVPNCFRFDWSWSVMESLEQTEVWCNVTFCSNHPVKEFVFYNFGIKKVNSLSLEMKLHHTSISFHIGPFVLKHSSLLLGWTFVLLDYVYRLSEICLSSFLSIIKKV